MMTAAVLPVEMAGTLTPEVVDYAGMIFCHIDGKQ